MQKGNLLTIVCLAIVLIFSRLSYSEEVGKVIIAINDVTIQRGAQEIELSRRSPIRQNDVIITGDDSKTQFRLIDGTLFSMGENSSLSIDKYSFNQAEAEAKFNLLKGVFRAVTAKITQVDEPKFEVITPVGSIGIRGTDFWGGYLDEGKVDVLLISGEHSIIVENEFGQVVLKHPGEGTTIEPNKAPTEPKIWPKEKVERAVATIDD